MSAPNATNGAMTAQKVALRLLRYIGVFTLDGTGGPEKLRAGDLDDVAASINGAMQEVWDACPAEMKTVESGIRLKGPTTVTLSVTEDSTTIASLTTWASWMQGCTIRINGDDQDNALLTQTTLAAPYTGTTGSVSATVYGDCIQLPSNASGVLGQVIVQNLRALHTCETQEEFLRWAGAPTVVDSSGVSASFSFYSFRKVVGTPLAVYLQGAIDVATASAVRRMRVAPMPDGGAYKLAYRLTLTPPIYSEADIQDVEVDGIIGDPGVTFPIANNWVESILLPLALQRFTATPAFKNEEAKAEIARQAKVAKGILAGTRGNRSVQHAVYL